jgi:hypothetical protein
MSLESTTLSDLIPMDCTFRSRCQIRRDIIATQRHEVLACNPRAAPAVLELYHWLTSTYLPIRYPSIYTPTGSDLRNNVTGGLLPMQLSAHNAEDALKLMGENIDDEFLFLLPSTFASDTSKKYRLEAFINCFPSGFNTRSKLNQLLADIHTPVPGYAQKLEKSMDRFFASLPFGKIIKRANWSISTNGQLFCLAGNHMSESRPRYCKGRRCRFEQDCFALRETDVASFAQDWSVGVCFCRFMSGIYGVYMELMIIVEDVPVSDPRPAG